MYLNREKWTQICSQTHFVLLHALNDMCIHLSLLPPLCLSLLHNLLYNEKNTNEIPSLQVISAKFDVLLTVYVQKTEEM